MAIGERIRFIRNLRGITQKALGISAGLPEKTADIRIAQYESGVRVPKQELTSQIADVLGISPNALNVPDIDSCTGVMHTLFTLEDLYGFVIIEHDGQPVIKLNPNCNKYPQLHRMLLDWLTKKQMLSSGAITREEYDDWRYGYVPEDDKD